jgi:hypothetical protein
MKLVVSDDLGNEEIHDWPFGPNLFLGRDLWFAAAEDFELRHPTGKRLEVSLVECPHNDCVLQQDSLVYCNECHQTIDPEAKKD